MCSKSLGRSDRAMAVALVACHNRFEALGSAGGAAAGARFGCTRAPGCAVAAAAELRPLWCSAPQDTAMREVQEG
eukprot:11172312-Lingulodinium_polyedra.AAC.1